MAITDRSARFAGTSAAMAEDIRGLDIPQLQNIVTVGYPMSITYNISLSANLTLPYTFFTLETDSEFLSVFTPQILSGSWESAIKMPNSIVISESAAIKVFGNIYDAIGKNMVLTHRINTSPKTTPKSGGVNYTIAAVMKDIPGNNSLMFMNKLDILRLNDSEGRFSYLKRNPSKISTATGTNTYILLREGATKEDFIQQLRSMNYTFKTIGYDCRLEAEDTDVTNGFILIAIITGIMGILVLATSLLNFFNFMVSMFYNKTREYSIRKVFGGEFKNLFCQLYVQSSIMVLLSSLLMLSIIELLGDSAFSFSVDVLDINLLLNTKTMIMHALQYTLFLLIGCAIICCFIAKRLYRISVYYGFRQDLAVNKVTGRNIMLWWQIFICWIFLGLVGGLLMQSNVSSSIVFPDLSREMKKLILSVNLNYTFDSEAKKKAIIDNISQQSGVEDVMVADVSLCEGISGNAGIYWIDNDSSYEKWNEVLILKIPSNFFSFMNIPIGQGKVFSTRDEVVVDRRLYDICGENLMGRTFKLSSDNNIYTISGVCDSDYKYSIYDKSPGFVFINCEDKDYVGHCYLKCAPLEVKRVQKYVDSLMRANLPISVEYRTTTLMDDIYSVQIIEYTLRKIVIFFALVCIIITILGVYSSISMDTNRRIREIAIMKVNGATGKHIAWKFTRLYATLLGTSAIIAFPLLYLIFDFWSTIYVQSFEYNMFFWLILFLFMSFLVGITICWKVAAIIKINPARIMCKE